MPEQSDPADVRVARIAAGQYGVVSIRQLREAGLSDDAVLERRRAGRLHRLHRGVYAVGHTAPCIERKWMAAVIAHGAGAVLSHRSAAELWGLLRITNGVVDISIPKRSGRGRREGIRLHRTSSLRSRDVTRRRRIPVTTPGRTIADIRPIVSGETLRHAVRQTSVLGLSLGVELMQERTRSELEYLFLRLCARHGLPTPRVNVPVGRWTVDFLWPDRRLIVETDGYRYHQGQVAFEDDHARDLELHELDFEVLRFSYRQVVDEPHKVVAALRRRLQPAGGST